MGLERETNQTRLFREALWSCGLGDLGCKGNQLSFKNKRQGCKEIKVCLHRAVPNQSRRLLFPSCKVSMWFANSSDHQPLIVQLQRRNTSTMASGQQFEGNRQRSQVEGPRENPLIRQLAECDIHLQSGNRKVFGKTLLSKADLYT